MKQPWRRKVSHPSCHLSLSVGICYNPAVINTEVDQLPDCIFCKIVEGELPAEKVYEDDHVIAFDDINPAAPTHVLIIPREHVPRLDDATDGDTELLGRIMQAARKIANDRGLSSDGFRVVMNVGAEAGQAVFHMHLHLLSGRGFSWPPG